MGKLTESMQGLREAIKRQENQLNNFVKNDCFEDVQLIHNSDFREEQQNLYQASDEQLQFKDGQKLHSVNSETSQASHWSCNLDTINSNIGDLKHVLKNQDKQVIRLMIENEGLKSELKKKEKELKKQKFLLKSERETFEQYKKDTLYEVKKHKSEEFQEIKSDNFSQELLKLKSELAHYRQLYIEQSHTVNRLSKLVSSLKDDKIQLKDKLLQHEKQYNKFILEMAQRFEISRKEFVYVNSKKFESSPLSPTNLAVCKMADRNARLAHDNSMLKLELNVFRQQLFEKNAEGSKLDCLTSRSVPYNKPPKEDKLTNFNDNKDEKDSKIVNLLKPSPSEKSGLTITSNRKTKSAVKTSVTSLTDKNSEKISLWQHTTCTKLNVLQWDCATRSSEGSVLVRTESAPELSTNNDLCD